MDKYEYNLKIDQMKSLCAEENYDAAADVADTISWSKVKNVNALVRAGEIYERVDRYEDAKEVLLMAYDRSPIGRMIIYRLAEIAVKMENFTEAADYYREFVDIAPRDNMRYVLRYEIRKAEGAELPELIKILEDYKSQEYTEEWGYELAYLYHKAGASEKCIEACDDLILWFGDGIYVERALELKMLYQPLTKAQEEKYRRFRLAKEGITTIDTGEINVAGEVKHEVVEIPQVTLSPERFNTVNLQEEIAKGMQQIMEATEKETVSDTMENIKKIVEDIPYLQLPKDEIPEEKGVHIATDEEIDGSLRLNFQELLGEDSDGQVSLIMEEKAALEHQITGQMTIQDVLDEWEKTKRAAEAVLEEANKQKLESAKARALQEAGDIMDRLNDVIPKLTAGASPRSLLEEAYLQPDKLEATTEAVQVEEADVSLDMLQQEDVSDSSEPAQQEDSNVIPEVADMEVGDLMAEVNAVIEVETISQEEPVPQEPVVEKVIHKEKKLEPAKMVHRNLTDAQKSIFSYFVPVKGMEEQICNALDGAVAQLTPGSTAKSGNIVIAGGRGCGKTVLATSILKVLQQETGALTGKVGKIDALALNKKDIAKLFKMVAGGCLIVERAGDLSKEAQEKMSVLMEKDTSGMIVILEDTSKGVRKAMEQCPEFAQKFTEKISVPIFTNDELVTFAKAYAFELGYEMDELAVLALYGRISGIQKLDQATTLTEVKEIVDEAIEREGKFGMKKYFSILTAKRYTDNDCILLLEDHFNIE